MRVVNKLPVLTMARIGRILSLQLFLAFIMHPVSTFSSTAPTPFYSTAVLDFSVNNKKQGESGKDIAILLTSYLSENNKLMMVERQDLETLIRQQALGKSRTVKKDSVAMVGQLTGAKIIISGAVMSLGGEQTLIAKIMGTETSRVFGVNEKIGAEDSIIDACLRLAQKITNKIDENADTLVATAKTPKEFIQGKKAALQGKQLPEVSVSIKEIHFGHLSIDPAGETEVSNILQQLGFNLIDIGKSDKKPDLEITGEAFSEKGIKRGDFISCRARVELKCIDRRTGNILFIDRQTEVAVDISQLVAGKSAIQLAASKLTERMIDKIVR